VSRLRGARRAGLLALALAMGGCLQQQTPEMSAAERAELAGVWRQADGPASLRFYPDGTVLVNLPARQPPLRFLSTYEPLKKGGIGINTGEVWLGPIICDWKSGAASMIVTLPEKQPVTLRLVRETGARPHAKDASPSAARR